MIKENSFINWQNGLLIVGVILEFIALAIWLVSVPISVVDGKLQLEFISTIFGLLGTMPLIAVALIGIRNTQY